MKKTKKGRATGIDEVLEDIMVMAECVGVRWARRLLNTCKREESMPQEWRTWLIVPAWKTKGMSITVDNTEVSYC